MNFLLTFVCVSVCMVEFPTEKERSISLYHIHRIWLSISSILSGKKRGTPSLTLILCQLCPSLVIENSERKRECPISVLSKSVSNLSFCLSLSDLLKKSERLRASLSLPVCDAEREVLSVFVNKKRRNGGV